MEVVFAYMLSLVVLYSLFLNPCYCLNLKLLKASKIQINEDEWQTATATWFGPPEGAGSDGGACGYTDTVEKPPLSKMISAGGPSLFNAGKGCGACYEVKCTENDACSGNPVTVVITDHCPGCDSDQSAYFDLSGTAFGSIAKPGQAGSLRNVGRLKVEYRRVACNFGKSIAFTIDSGANPYYFATGIEYENGDGDLVEIYLKQDHESETWLPMQRSWGAIWVLNSGSGLRAPFSIKLTEAGKDGNKTVVADSVIPDGWQPNQVYRSAINF